MQAALRLHVHHAALSMIFAVNRLRTALKIEKRALSTGSLLASGAGIDHAVRSMRLTERWLLAVDVEARARRAGIM